MYITYAHIGIFNPAHPGRVDRSKDRRKYISGGVDQSLSKNEFKSI